MSEEAVVQIIALVGIFSIAAFITVMAKRCFCK
jgi:hypothetical protein